MECLGFNVDCGTLAKGAGVTLMGFILFVGSVYLLLSAVLGRWMGYLVVAVTFFGWVAVLSSLWAFGFYSQGPDTPVNLGPRGAEAAWVPLLASSGETSGEYAEFASYPEGPWEEAETGELPSSTQAVTGIVTDFLAEQANEELEIAPTEDGKTSLAVVQAHFSEGGPLVTVSLFHSSGSVQRYSFLFLIGSVILFAVHLPFLDRAERKRREFLTGGTAPAWYGPA